MYPLVCKNKYICIYIYIWRIAYGPQAKVVAAQAAVESYRSGCDPEPDSEPEPDDATPSTGNPEQRDGGASSMAPAEGGAHDGEAVRDEKQTEVEDEETGIDGKDVGSADVVEVRRKEEAAALSSHLQVIVMHLVRWFVAGRVWGGGRGGVFLEYRACFMAVVGLCVVCFGYICDEIVNSHYHACRK